MTNILVVDDEPDILELTERLLLSNGYEVFIAHDGDEAMELLIQNDIDLVVLDIMMPGKHGLDVIRDMRKTKDLMNIPVLVFSALGSGTRLMLEKENQPDGYVQKPFRANEFLRQVEKMLAKPLTG